MIEANIKGTVYKVSSNGTETEEKYSSIPQVSMWGNNWETVVNISENKEKQNVQNVQRKKESIKFNKTTREM